MTEEKTAVSAAMTSDERACTCAFLGMISALSDGIKVLANTPIEKLPRDYRDKMTKTLRTFTEAWAAIIALSGKLEALSLEHQFNRQRETGSPMWFRNGSRFVCNEQEHKKCAEKGVCGLESMACGGIGFKECAKVMLTEEGVKIK